MTSEANSIGTEAGVPLAPGGPAMPAEGAGPAGGAGGMRARLAHHDPRSDAREPLAVRCETVTGLDGLKARISWWRDLVSAAEPTNPALDPEAVLCDLATRPANPRACFVFIWRESGGDEPAPSLRRRDLIALLPLRRAGIGRLALPIASSWAPGWWPVGAPLVHRRHARLAAITLAGWVGRRADFAGGIVLRDVDRDGAFAAALLERPGTCLRPRPRVHATGGLEPLVRELSPPDGVELRAGEALTGSVLESDLALLALWSGQVGASGSLATGAIGKGQLNYFLAAARASRLLVAQTSRAGHASALAIGLRAGGAAFIVAAGASHRLLPGQRGEDLSRALHGLIAGLDASGAITAIEAPPGGAPQVKSFLGCERRLADIVVTGPGPAGGGRRLAEALSAAFALVRRRP